MPSKHRVQLTQTPAPASASAPASNSTAEWLQTRCYTRRVQGSRRLLKSYQSYYNEVRTHLSLDENAPVLRIVQALSQGRMLSPALVELHRESVWISFSATERAVYLSQGKAWLIAAITICRAGRPRAFCFAPGSLMTMSVVSFIVGPWRRETNSPKSSLLRQRSLM